jgi:hypothetical protein
VRGKVASAGDPRQARVEIKTRKAWKTIGTAAIRADGTFKLHLPRRKGDRRVLLRVIVPGVGKSRTLRVRL